jgi:hypothetical protein
LESRTLLMLKYPFEISRSDKMRGRYKLPIL